MLIYLFPIRITYDETMIARINASKKLLLMDAFV